MRFLPFLLLTPAAAFLLGFGFVNREPTAIRFDPTGNFAAPVTLPLYVALFAALAVGVACGGIAAWAGQGRRRRAAREAEAEAARLRDELAAARASRPALAARRA